MRASRVLLYPALLAACGGGGMVPPPAGADLSGFAVERITVGAQEFEVWLAQTSLQHQQGFMFATEEQLDPLPDGTPRGMLFVFNGEFFLSFWMRNTFVPLDLAYVRADGTIAEIHALTPLDETRVPSGEAVQFALEVFRGTLAAHGIGVGDTIVLPPGVVP